MDGCSCGTAGSPISGACPTNSSTGIRGSTPCSKGSRPASRAPASGRRSAKSCAARRSIASSAADKCRWLTAARSSSRACRCPTATACSRCSTSPIRRRPKTCCADAVKTRFLANMSYEFRTPLTSIGGFAELLQSGVAGELTPQAQEYLAAILSAVERLRAQIESVLDLTQSEAGLLPIATEDIELLPFVTNVVREREDALEAKD